MNDAVLIAAIPVIGGIITTVLVINNKRAKIKESAAQPKDRMETIFDGYEAFIERQDKSLEYKDKQLAENQIIINRMQIQIDELQELIEIQKRETDKERQINKHLHEELDRMRKEYTDNKFEKMKEA